MREHDYIGGNFYRRVLMFAQEGEQPISAADLRAGMRVRREISREMCNRGCQVPGVVTVAEDFEHGSYVIGHDGKRTWHPHTYQPHQIMNHGGRYKLSCPDGSVSEGTCIPSSPFVLVQDTATDEPAALPDGHDR